MKGVGVDGASVVEDDSLNFSHFQNSLIDDFAKHLMCMSHIQIETCEHRHLHQQIEPWEVDETGNVECDGSGVKRKDVCPFHHGQAQLSEPFSECLWHLVNRTILLLELSPELLELRRLLLLTARVVDIGDEEELVNDISLPWCFLINGLLLC